jgi:transcriptional regulator with XRE-family HTH domain
MGGMKQNPLKAWRADHKLSQKLAAERIGVPAMTLSRWERGDHFPHKKYWQSIEDATGIAPSVLVEHVKLGGAQ